MCLSFWMVWSEFKINNIKTWIQLTSACWWWYFLEHLNIVEYFRHLMTTVHPSTDGYSSRNTWLYQQKLSCSQITYTVTR